MKIAVPTKIGNVVDDHFGHCEFYTIFTIENDEVVGKEVFPSPQGCGCKSEIARDLSEKGVKVMLAGGIGAGAISKLAAQDISVVRNCKGVVDDLLKDYLSGKVVDGGSSCEAHSQHAKGQGLHVCHH